MTTSEGYTPKPKPKPVRPPKPRRPNQNKLRILAERRKKSIARQASARKTIAKRQQETRSRGTAIAKISPETEQRLDSLKRDFDNLQDEISLADIYEDMGEVESMLTNLESDLDALRTRGYVFQNYLERKVDVLTEKWEAIDDDIDDDIEDACNKLTREADKVERLVGTALTGNERAIDRAETAVNNLKEKAEAAHTALRNRYQDAAQTIRQTNRQLEGVKWAFAQAGQADFDFLEGEYLIAACKAEMLDHPKDKEGDEGILYLTDERLLFEQKEKVVTKKFLFVTTESETVQNLKFEALLGWLEDIKAQDKRKFLSSKELLNLRLSNEAPIDSITFHLKSGAKNEDWAQRLNRAISGEIERERIAEAVEEKTAAAEQVSEAPTACSNCGAPFPATIARGQTGIECEYCGAITRL